MSHTAHDLRGKIASLDSGFGEVLIRGTVSSILGYYTSRRSMASVGEPLNRSPFANNSQGFNPHLAKSIPILPSSAASATSPGDPMDTSQNHTPPMGPPVHSSPNGDRMSEQPGSDPQHQTSNGGSNQPVGAAAAAQQPKVVQTAFIHKLYKSVTLF